MTDPDNDMNPKRGKFRWLKILGWLIGGYVVLGTCVGIAGVASEVTVPPQPTEPALTLWQLRTRAKTVTFDDLARYPDRYDGELVHVCGEVIQAMDGGSTTSLRVSITQGDYGWWSDPVYVSWRNDAGVTLSTAGRILEDDIAIIYGRGLGLTSYEAINGATITLPLIQALNVSLQEECPSAQQGDE